jgi:hypothetical protein
MAFARAYEEQYYETSAASAVGNATTFNALYTAAVDKYRRDR